MNSRSIVLTGFMGTGKTLVGRSVAHQLSREFVDMDTLIETREGKTVSAIFEMHGENYFRSIESALCQELSARNGLVIATGGGALINLQNQDMFASAFVVCLDATTDEIVTRLSGKQDRPLLANDDPRERVQALLNARRAAYTRIQHHVDTTGQSIEQVADRVTRMFQANGHST
jgi:shikimate kinase